MLFGATELATRSLSLLFGLGTIGLAFVAGKKIFDSRAVGLWVAVILAVLPMQIEFGQEARPYTMLCFFGTAAFILLWEYLRTKRTAQLAGYLLCSLAGVYLHYSFAFVSLTLAGWWLWRVVRDQSDNRPRAFVHWLVAHGFLFLGFYPWLQPLLYKISLGGYDFYGLSRNAVPYRQPEYLEMVLHKMIWLTKEKGIMQVELLAIILSKALLLWALVTFVRNLKIDRRQIVLRPLTYLLWLAAIPLVMFIASPQSVPYSTIHFRHVLFMTVPLALILGRIAVAIPRRQAAVVLAVFFVTLVPSVSRVAMNDALWDYDFRLEEAGEIINENYRPGDLVVVTVVGIRTDLAHYLWPEIPVQALLPTNFYGNDISLDRHRLGVIENEMQVRIRRTTSTAIDGKMDRLIAAGDYDRVWLFPFHEEDYFVHDYFQERDWRWVYRNVGNILRLDMYAKE